MKGAFTDWRSWVPSTIASAFVAVGIVIFIAGWTGDDDFEPAVYLGTGLLVLTGLAWLGYAFGARENGPVCARENGPTEERRRRFAPAVGGAVIC